MYNKKRRRYGTNEYYSISNKLKSENKTNDEFEVMLSGLTLEEIIGLRLELAAKAVDHKLYGLKIWQTIPNIVKEAILTYTVADARTKGEAAAFLGINKADLRKLIKKFDIKGFFEKSDD